MFNFHTDKPQSGIEKTLCNNQIINSFDRFLASSGSSHCPLVNLSCDWSNYTDSLNSYQCVGNKGKGIEIRLLSRSC